MAKTKSIQYKQELFDLINDLCSISPSIGFENIDGRVTIRKCDDERTIPYTLSAPMEYFDISELDEPIGFYNYPNFYSFLDMMKDPKIRLDGINQLYLTGDGVRINYILSDAESIINGPSSSDFADEDYEVTLSSDDIAEIVKMNGLIKAERAIVKCTDEGFFLKFYTDETEHSFVRQFECQRLSDYEEPIQFEIRANRFSYLPAKRDYKILIKKEGYMLFQLLHDELKLDIFSGRFESGDE